jgi:hypothetical protein
MTSLSTPRTTWILLLIAAVFVSLAFALCGIDRGIAALVGATLSVINWLALRWLTGRIVRADSPGKGVAGLLLVGKIGLLMGAIYILISRLHLDPLGLAFGLGVLFIGPVVVGLAGAGQSNDALRAAAPGTSSTREER